MKKSKKKFEVVIESYGLYTQWRSSSRELPKIIEFTNIIRAYAGNEFGMILRIKKGKTKRESPSFLVQSPVRKRTTRTKSQDRP